MRKTPLNRNVPLSAHSELKRNPIRRKRSQKARSKEFSSQIRQTVMERSNGICELCHMRRIAHLHHATFRSQQGTGELSNAIGLCLVCHENAHSHRAIRELCVEVARELAEGVTT